MKRKGVASWLAREFALAALLFVPLVCSVAFVSGCAEQPPKLEAKVTTPIGHEGVCSFCNRKIEKVSEDQVVTINGVQYVVCSQSCAEQLKKWAAEQ